MIPDIIPPSKVSLNKLIGDLSLMSNPARLIVCLTFSSDIRLIVFLTIFLCLFAPISVNKRIVRRVEDFFRGGDLVV